MSSVSKNQSYTDHILLFTKHPASGFAKTRLIPSQGPHTAADISRILTEHTLVTVRKYHRAVHPVHTFIHHANPPHVPQTATAAWLKPLPQESLIPQSSGSLGDRLISAFDHSFSQLASNVIVIGTDSPDISPELLRQAFQALDQYDIVIGPAIDGGYYLLGMTRMHRHLFVDISWSTDTVYRDTVAKASANKLSVFNLPTLRDIDELEDLLEMPALNVPERDEFGPV